MTSRPWLVQADVGVGSGCGQLMKGGQLPVNHGQARGPAAAGAAADEDPVTQGGHAHPVDEGGLILAEGHDPHYLVQLPVPAEEVLEPVVIGAALKAQGPVALVGGGLALVIGGDPVQAKVRIADDGAQDRVSGKVLDRADQTVLHVHFQDPEALQAPDRVRVGGIPAGLFEGKKGSDPVGGGVIGERVGPVDIEVAGEELVEDDQRLVGIEGIEAGVLVALVEGLGGPGQDGAEVVVEKRLARRGSRHEEQGIFRVGCGQRGRDLRPD